MNALPYKIFVWFFSILMLVAAVYAAYMQEYVFLFIPFILLAAMHLVQHPEHGFYALMLVIPWSIEYNFTPAIGTDLPDEPLMLVAALAGIILLITYRKNLKKEMIHPLLVVLAIQLVWLLITVIASTELLPSVKYFLAKTWYVLAFVVLPLFLFRDKEVLRRSILFLLFSMLAFMFVALIKHAGNNWSFEKINESLEPFYRNHVNYSALLVFMVPLQLAVISLTASKPVKRFVQFTLVVTVGALYFSYSRGAWLALIGGLVAYWLIRRKWLFASYLVFIAVCIGVVFWLRSNDRYLDFAPHYQTTIFHTDFKEHLVATYQLKDVSTAERFHRWVGGVRMINDSWKTGFGPSSFYKQYKSYTQPAFKTWVSKNEEQSTVHNYFLLLIIEQGVMGLLLFVILLGLMFWYVQKIYHRTNNKTWKAIMAATGAILIMQCVINSLSDLIETDKVGSVFYLCLSVIIIGDFATKKDSRMECGDNKRP